VPPVDVLVLDLHRLAAPAAGVQRADDSVAHLVAGREFRFRIPNLSRHDLAAERLRDVEDGREVALRGAGIRPRAGSRASPELGRPSRSNGAIRCVSSGG